MDCSLKLVHANISLHYVYGCAYKYKKWMNQIKVKSAYTCFLFVYIYTLVVCCSFPCFVTVKKDMLLKNVCCHLYNDKNVVLRWILMHICSLSIWLSQTDSHTNTNTRKKTYEFFTSTIMIYIELSLKIFCVDAILTRILVIRIYMWKGERFRRGKKMEVMKPNKKNEPTNRVCWEENQIEIVFGESKTSKFVMCPLCIGIGKVILRLCCCCFFFVDQKPEINRDTNIKWTFPRKESLYTHWFIYRKMSHLSLSIYIQSK